MLKNVKPKERNDIIENKLDLDDSQKTLLKSMFT